jgi:hypothetical protein
MDGETDDVSQQLWESESYNADVERRQAAQKAILFGRAPIASGALESPASEFDLGLISAKDP